MTDSIPQQAGPGAGADELWKQRHERVVEWAHDVFNNKLHPINMAHMVHAMYHLAAPLAVEDSRERCALTDESIDTLLASVGPTQGMRPDSRDLTLAQVRKLVRAAMAAASSGKEN